jgi:hypothetical protein
VTRQRKTIDCWQPDTETNPAPGGLDSLLSRAVASAFSMKISASMAVPSMVRPWLDAGSRIAVQQKDPLPSHRLLQSVDCGTERAT